MLVVTLSSQLMARLRPAVFASSKAWPATGGRGRLSNRSLPAHCAFGDLT